jgi:hypothetical protein
MGVFGNGDCDCWAHKGAARKQKRIYLHNKLRRKEENIHTPKITNSGQESLCLFGFKPCTGLSQVKVP